MSDDQELHEEISEGVTKVISDALARRGGGFLQGFVGAAAYLTDEGGTESVFYVMDKQGAFLTMGLRDGITMIVDAQAAMMFFAQDDDEDS